MKKYLGIASIIIIGIVLRLLFIDKPDGLWNDEYVSWMIASVHNGFWDAVKSQCHMPIYYIYLKIFMSIFGNSDILLRLTSVLAGVIAIPVMYSVGKEKDDFCGYCCASYTAISSFLIYYSQEVRLYSLLFLISACSLLYTLRLIKTPNLKNSILFSVFNLLIISTHTIGFVFVFFNLCLISFNLYKQYKKQIAIMWIILSSGLICALPLILKIFTTPSYSQWWGHFSFSKIVFLFTDYFSPVLTNLTNAPDNIFYMPKTAIFMLFPAIIAFLFILKSLTNNLNRQLFILFIAFITTLVIASLSGRLVFITKYSIEIYPILIFLACSGIEKINNRTLKKSLIVIFCIITAGFLFCSPYSAFKIRRAEGHKIPMELIKNANIKSGDYIILLYYPKERFEKYFDFSDYNVISINKGNFHEYLSEGKTYQDAYKNGKLFYKNTFLSSKNDYFEKILSKKVLNNLQNGQSVILIVLDSVSLYDPETLSKIVQKEEQYSKTPLLFLVFSYFRNKTFEDMVKTLAVTRIERKGKWAVVKFTKLNK